MQRREARLRKEYLYRKSLEDKEKKRHQQKELLQTAIDKRSAIPLEIKKSAVELARETIYDEGLEGTFEVLYYAYPIF